MTSNFPFGFTYLVELFNAQGELVSSEVCHNLVPTEGLNHAASVVFAGGAQVGTWYVGVFEGNYTPTSTDAAANIATRSTESTAYTPAARQQIVFGSVANGALDNTASLAQFTFSALKTIYGGFIVSSSPQGSATGTLISSVRFPSPKVCDVGSVLRVTAAVAFAST